MMRYLFRASLLVLILLGFSTALLAAPRYTRIVVGSREVALSPRAVLEDGAVYAPVSLLRSLDVNHVQGKEKVTILLGEDPKELDLVKIGGNPMLRVDEIAKLLNVERQWDEQTSTLRLLAKLTSVEFEGSIMTARTSLPVTVSYTRLWTDPWRVSVDLAGTKVATESKAFNVNAGPVSQVRVGQFQDETARVVMDVKGSTPFRVLTSGPSREIKVAIGTGNTAASGTPPSAESTVKDAPSVPVTITAITPHPEGDGKITVTVKTSSRAAFDTLMIDGKATLDIRNATLDMDASEITVDHPMLKSISITQQNKNVRLVLDSDKFPAFFAEPRGDDILVRIFQPSNSGGKLSDKVIVLDPGHGGLDPGAGAGGVKEKDINLLIALQVKARLEEAGAKVVLTRYDDRYLGKKLEVRPAVADKCSADFFISIHCNAIAPNRASGIETYYSAKLSSNKALALSVHEQIIKMTGMKNRRAINRPGLAVLKHANVPALLIECGYIDHSHDRKLLCDEGYRDKLARAIVQGLRQYVEGRIRSEGN